MSKLNDSTLKILKKYRLDTDMSVFGNENKLYDVVKVMDDMVGNQVSDINVNMPYLDSNHQIKISYFAEAKSGTNPVYTPTIGDMTIRKPITSGYHEYVFDALSFKYLGDNATADIMKYGYLLLFDGTKLFLGISDVARLYYDAECTNEIPSDYTLTQGYVFVSHVLIRNDVLNNNTAKPICSGLHYYYLFGLTSDDVNNTTHYNEKKYYASVSPASIDSVVSAPKVIKEAISKSKLYTRSLYSLTPSLPLDATELNIEIKVYKT